MAKPDLNLPRLCTAIHRSRLVLKTFRDERREAVKEYVGRHWSDDGSRTTVPVNLISQYVSIVSRNLIAKNPRVMLSTFQQESKPIVSAMQSWANKRIEQIRLADTLQRVVIDALFSIGICKVALATPADSASTAWNLGAGQPFAERVDLDDFVFDCHARDFSEVAFIGHRYRAPLEVVKDSRLYSKARKVLQPSQDQPYNLEGDERTTSLQRMPYGILEDEYEDMVDLWEIYLPRHRLVVTLADDQMLGGNLDDRGEPLRVQEWLGPDSGPYHILAFGVVPGNAMPKAPVQDLIDLHTAANSCYRKLIRQAERMKDLTVVGANGTDDGDSVRTANDGDIIKANRPENVRAVPGMGPNPQLFGMAEQLKNLFDFMGGNLALMGGLSPQSKTATQDEMLNANASKQIADLQDRVITLTTDVVKALCWYWHHSPTGEMPSEFTIPGVGVTIPRNVTPQQRLGTRFADMEIKVDPYSIAHSTPQQRVQQMQLVVTTVVLPMMQLLQQQGVGFDINAYLIKLGQYLDMPDLAEILSVVEPPTENAPASSDEPTMPAQTKRTYERVSRPGTTEKGLSQQVMAHAMNVDIGGASGGNKAAQMAGSR